MKFAAEAFDFFFSRKAGIETSRVMISRMLRDIDLQLCFVQVFLVLFCLLSCVQPSCCCYFCWLISILYLRFTRKKKADSIRTLFYGPFSVFFCLRLHVNQGQDISCVLIISQSTPESRISPPALIACCVAFSK